MNASVIFDAPVAVASAATQDDDLELSNASEEKTVAQLKVAEQDVDAAGRYKMDNHDTLLDNNPKVAEPS